MRSFSYVLLFLLLFLAENVYGRIGLPLSWVQYTMLLFVLSTLALFIIGAAQARAFYTIEAFAIVFFTFRSLVLGRDGLYMATSTLFAPAIICHFFYTVIVKCEGKCIFLYSRLFLLFYVLECSMAVMEKIIGVQMFGWATPDDVIFISGVEDFEFRSTAMLGHPLQNALIVSTIMGFILFSDMALKYKLALWGLGYAAVLCFNTRSSMVGDATVLGCYFLYNMLFKSKGRSKIKFLFAGLMSAGVILYVLLYTNMGGRLTEMGLFDDSSAQVRVDVWSIFDYFSISSFLWGHSYEAAKSLVAKAGLVATENFWIDWMLFYGVVVVGIYALLMYKVIKFLYNKCRYDTVSAVATATVFLLIASTNNSLSVAYGPLFIFLFCILLFAPQYQNLFPKRLFGP